MDQKTILTLGSLFFFGGFALSSIMEINKHLNKPRVEESYLSKNITLFSSVFMLIGFVALFYIFISNPQIIQAIYNSLD